MKDDEGFSLYPEAGYGKTDVATLPRKEGSFSVEVTHRVSRILIAYKDVKECLALKHFLQEAGYEISVLLDEKEVLNRLQAGHIDLLILHEDMLPLVNLDSCPTIPLLLITGPHPKIEKLESLSCKLLGILSEEAPRWALLSLVKTGLSMAQLHLQLRQREKELEAANAQRHLLISFLNHDLRNVVVGILNATEFMSMGKFNAEELAEIVREMNISTTELNSVLCRLLEYCELKAGKKNLSSERVDMESLLEEITSKWSKNLEKISIEVYSPVPPVLADRGAITRILDILLDNAIRYSVDGSKISIRAKQEKDVVRLEVRDYGIGVEPQHLESIFKPLFRSLPAARLNPEGKGMGLSIAAAYAQAQGGRLWAEVPEEGVGSLLILTLPAAEKVFRASFRGPRKILLVEDNRLLAMAWARALEINNMSVDWFPNAREVLEKVGSTKYDILIFDIVLPDIDGITLYEQMKEKANIYLQIPAVFISYLSQKEIIQRAYAAGAVEYIVKGTLTLENLVERVKRILDGELPEGRSIVAEESTVEEKS